MWALWPLYSVHTAHKEGRSYNADYIIYNISFNQSNQIIHLTKYILSLYDNLHNYKIIIY